MNIINSVDNISRKATNIKLFDSAHRDCAVDEAQHEVGDGATNSGEGDEQFHCLRGYEIALV